MPYAGILIPPEGVQRITGTVAVQRLRGIAEIHIGRHETVLSCIDHALVVVRNSKHRAPGEFLRDDVAGRESCFNASVAGASHIGEIGVISRGLVRLHREKKVGSI